MKRKPLAELPNRANARSMPRPKSDTSQNKSTTSVAVSSHAEIMNSKEPPAKRVIYPGSPASKRVARLGNGGGIDSKRNSAISTTSTNASAGRQRKSYIGHWQLGRTIGKGGCSKVREVRHRHTLQHGAVKIITRHVAENTRAQSLANLVESVKGSLLPLPTDHQPIPYGLGREIAVMKLLEHPNIVRLYDVWENRSELYLIMELVSGKELFTYVDQRKYLEEDETIYIFRQIVSALLYCHRLLICHRDLKPENIMLDDELNVKIIDFGMAALQPQGRLLSTPCGSPHYAAPEVISSKPYDGTKADVWSCGVILYVMLTGTTPFNYQADGHIRNLFRDITRARYDMPQDLSLEAQDLIQRIFVPDPSQRITMDEVWEHPLLHKYDDDFGFVGPEASKEAAIGSLPHLHRWKVSDRSDIDREILSNMRTLWHSEPESTLIQRLLSDEHNQEKLFYAALLKHREENMENFSGDADLMGYSTSDYHHGGLHKPLNVPSPAIVKAARSQSQYSIMNDEHLRPCCSFVGPPPSMSSYDPYRASKSPITSSSRDYLNVTVHRHGSNSTTITTTLPGLHSASVRRSVASTQNARISAGSGMSLTRSGRSKSSFPRSSVSRISLRSSQWPSSPPVIAASRPSDVHKRAVSFNHLRKTSIASRSHGRIGGLMTPRQSRRSRISPAKANRDGKSPRTPSPTTRPLQIQKSRGTKTPLRQNSEPCAKQQLDSPDFYISSTVRKHSAELEKACEEAFFRSSVGSDLTVRPSPAERRSFSEPPPVSILDHASPESIVDTHMARVLPPIPADGSNVRIIKTLEDARYQLANSRGKPLKGFAKYDEVMRAIDAFLDEPTPAPALPVISEESDVRISRDAPNWHRSVVSSIAQDRKLSQTVRMVPPSSPDSPAPLSIRKRAVVNLPKDNTQVMRQASPRSIGLDHSQATLSMSGLLSDLEPSLPGTPTIRKKRSLWFSLNNKNGEGNTVSQQSLKQKWFASLDDRVERSVLQEPEVDPLQLNEVFSEDSSEFPFRPKRKVERRKVLAKWIGKISRVKIADSTTGIERSRILADHGSDLDCIADLPPDTSVQATQSAESLFSMPSSIDGPQPTGLERSWFARFFRIKPATAILCFRIPRTRARRETAALLKEWHRYGVRDVQQSRATHSLTFRVDKMNTLNIKPVTIRVEFFVVLERGRKNGFSIARFSQVKGAASSFRRVLEVVDSVMRSRGWLVEDEDQWRALCEIVRTP